MTSAKTGLSRLASHAGCLLDLTAALILFILMALTCVDVAGRYLLNAPLFGATEMIRLMMGVMIFLALPVIFGKEEHIAVDLLDSWFKGKMIVLRQILINGLATVLMLGLAQRMWVLTWRSQEYGDTTEYLFIPLWPISAFMTVMVVLSACITLFLTVRYLHALVTA